MRVHRCKLLDSMPLLFLVLFMGLARCALAQPVTSDQATALVSNWIRLDPSPLNASLGHKTAGATTYKDSEGRVAYFVVKLLPSGFVIVSADDLVEPIVAFADTGAYNPSSSNPLGALVSRDVSARAAAVRAIDAQAKPMGADADVAGPASDARIKWRRLLGSAVGELSLPLGLSTLTDPRVDPLVMSHWDQSSVCGDACYNYYTPPYAAGSVGNYYTGCVATATAQLMRFHQHPVTAVGTASFDISVCGTPETRALRGGDGAGGAYDWQHMILQPSCSAIAVQRRAIGALCHDVGVSSHMDYCSTGSGALLIDAVSALKSVFSFSNAKYADSYWNIAIDKLHTMINPNLQAGYPVLLGILGNDNGNIFGHAVVCDGYGYDASTIYHHLNMGWEGTDDAWYNLPDIDTSKGAYSAVSGCAYNVYTSGSGEIIAGRVTDLSGNPISGSSIAAGSYSATTNSRGLYALAKVSSNTTYAVIPHSANHVYAPRSATTGSSQDWGSRCGNLWGIDFVGRPAIGVADAKTNSNGVTVGCKDFVVTAVFGDYFYGEDTERTMGICIHRIGHGLSVGAKVDVIGDMTVNSDSERFIEASSIAPAGSGSIAPIAMTNKLMGGGDWHTVPGGTGGQRGVKDGLGLNNVGLLVKVCGIVTYVDPGGALAYVDDGSALDDGNTLGYEQSAVIGVRVALPAGVTMPEEGTIVAVTGISSMISISDNCRRVLKARYQTDINTLRPKVPQPQ